MRRAQNGPKLVSNYKETKQAVAFAINRGLWTTIQMKNTHEKTPTA